MASAFRAALGGGWTPIVVAILDNSRTASDGRVVAHWDRPRPHSHAGEERRFQDFKKSNISRDDNDAPRSALGTYQRVDASQLRRGGRLNLNSGALGREISINSPWR